MSNKVEPTIIETNIVLSKTNAEKSGIDLAIIDINTKPNKYIEKMSPITVNRK